MLLQLAGSHIPHPHLCLIQNRLQNHCTHNSVAETHPQHQNIVTLPHLQMQLKGSKVTQKIKNWPHAAVKKLDNTIHWINHYPVDRITQLVSLRLVRWIVIYLWIKFFTPGRL